VSNEKLALFDIKQPVYFVDLLVAAILKIAQKQKTVYKEVAKYPPVQRDIAMVVDKQVKYEDIQNAVRKLKLPTLQSIRLFDVFESDKLGVNKKSMAVNFIFIDEEKTLTDKEIEEMMNKLISLFKKELSAEIRK
jgi:phenylalanyl-tRNA synthetase beta chain